MYNRLDSIPACNRQTDEQTDRRTDRQTDGQTSCHSIVRAMHTRRAVKISYTAKINKYVTRDTSLHWQDAFVRYIIQ